MNVSVVIPVCNKAPYLGACIESVLGQTYGDLEIIAVDDASTDGSLDVLHGYMDDRLKVVALPQNLGPAGAAQHAMDLATGTYILRVDADDILLPQRCARQVEFLDAHPEVGVLGTGVHIIGDSVTTRERATNDADLRAQLLFGVAVFQPTSAYRAAVLKAHGLRYEPTWPRYGEDWLFQVRLARHTRFANLPEPLVTYRHGPQGISFGLDRGAVLVPLFSDVFQHLDIPHQQETFALHAMALGTMPATLNAGHVLAFRAWLDALLDWNQRVAWTTSQAMHDRVDRAWEGLFPHLPAHGLEVVNAYRRAGGRMDMSRWYYLMRTWFSRARRTTFGLA